MRITARQLRQIIKEEVENMMYEEDATDMVSALKSSANFKISYTFEAGLGGSFFKENGAIKSGNLEYSIYKSADGVLRAAPERFLDDSGTTMSLRARPANLKNGQLPSVLRGIPAPAGAVAGQKINIPATVAVTISCDTIEYNFKAV
jgi:hypothetical protein